MPVSSYLRVLSIAFITLLLSMPELRAQQSSRDPIQSVHREGVPHTDKNGRPLSIYDPEHSFFPIGMWGVALEYDGSDWRQLKDASFNTAWPWFDSMQHSLEQGDMSDMQIVLMHSAIPSVSQLQSLPAVLSEHLLGIQYYDEPSFIDSRERVVREHYNRFVDYRNSIREVFPEMPVFVTDAHPPLPQIANLWKDFARTGDIASQDNFTYNADTLRTLGRTSSPTGISEQISAANIAVQEQTPVWALVGLFDNPSGAMRFLTPTQMRAKVYSAIIHGATGINYNMWDGWHTRAMGLIGISPNPPLSGYGVRADEISITPEQQQQSIALWNGVSAVNAELLSLSSAILSPTVSPDELEYSFQVHGLSEPDSELFAPNPIRTLLKRDEDGNYILFAVNLDDRSMDVTFQFSRSFNDPSILFEGSGAADALAPGNQFTRHFSPFDVNVFKLSQPVPEPGGGILSCVGIALFCLISRFRYVFDASVDLRK